MLRSFVQAALRHAIAKIVGLDFCILIWYSMSNTLIFRENL